MKLLSWNVNGLRACIKSGHFAELPDFDILALQEIKMRREQLAEPVLDGYFSYWNSASKAGYSGTAVFSKTEPKSATYGIGQTEHDNEGRVITLRYDDFTFVTVYTPNSQDELRRLDYRMNWEDAFRSYLLTLDRENPVIICGDMNVAHNEIDLKNPKTNRRNPGFTDEERSKFTALLQSGFADTFRRLHPDAKDAYSWWSYRANARVNNVGWRIDYFLTSERLLPSVTEAAILPHQYGSDHCPVQLTVIR
ncbi:MAG: exodeoxyribonuclease III [Oscillospiraceae bacterium]|jgi:exodeoxyribonuclease-3|nr:exodeoxyribonuclease III [Oscillospiraceae bacterium]